MGCSKKEWKYSKDLGKRLNIMKISKLYLIKKGRSNSGTSNCIRNTIFSITTYPANVMLIIKVSF